MILAIDTSTSFLVLGLWDEHTSIDLTREVGRRHAEQLPAAMAELLGQAGGGRNVTGIVVGIGPGSYTGLRVGASYALGLGRAWGVPVLGLSSLEGVAARAKGEVAVSMDARREHVYGAVYHVLDGEITRTILEPGKLTLDEFTRFTNGRVWLRDEPPSGAALARLSVTRATRNWQLQYA